MEINCFEHSDMTPFSSWKRPFHYLKVASSCNLLNVFQYFYLQQGNKISTRLIMLRVITSADDR